MRAFHLTVLILIHILLGDTRRISVETN